MERDDKLRALDAAVAQIEKQDRNEAWRQHCQYEY